MKDLPKTDNAVAQWCKDVFLAKVIIFFLSFKQACRRLLTLHLVQQHVFPQCLNEIVEQTMNNLPIFLYYYHVIDTVLSFSLS